MQEKILEMFQVILLTNISFQEDVQSISISGSNGGIMCYLKEDREVDTNGDDEVIEHILCLFIFSPHAQMDLPCIN